jgi:ELWxxDGT repeat protein
MRVSRRSGVAVDCLEQRSLLAFVPLTGPVNEPGFTSPSQLTSIGSRVLFKASTLSSGPALWTSDGTTAGTRLLRDFRPGPDVSRMEIVANTNRFAILRVDVNDRGTGCIYVTDGTEQGTFELAAQNRVLVEVRDWYEMPDGRMLFAMQVNELSQLWITGGTLATSQRLAEFVDDDDGAEHFSSVGGNSRTAFVIDGSRGDDEVWSTDGTVAGTRRLHKSNGEIVSLGTLGSRIVFGYSNPANIQQNGLYELDARGDTSQLGSFPLVYATQHWQKSMMVAVMGVDRMLTFMRWDGASFRIIKVGGATSIPFADLQADNNTTLRVEGSDQFSFTAREQVFYGNEGGDDSFSVRWSDQTRKIRAAGAGETQSVFLVGTGSAGDDEIWRFNDDGSAGERVAGGLTTLDEVAQLNGNVFYFRSSRELTGPFPLCYRKLDGTGGEVQVSHWTENTIAYSPQQLIAVDEQRMWASVSGKPYWISRAGEVTEATGVQSTGPVLFHGRAGESLSIINRETGHRRDVLNFVLAASPIPVGNTAIVVGKDFLEPDGRVICVGQALSDGRVVKLAVSTEPSSSFRDLANWSTGSGGTAGIVKVGDKWAIAFAGMLVLTDGTVRGTTSLLPAVKAAGLGRRYFSEIAPASDGKSIHVLARFGELLPTTDRDGAPDKAVLLRVDTTRPTAAAVRLFSLVGVEQPSTGWAADVAGNLWISAGQSASGGRGESFLLRVDAVTGRVDRTFNAVDIRTEPYRIVRAAFADGVMLSDWNGALYYQGIGRERLVLSALSPASTYESDPRELFVSGKHLYVAEQLGKMYRLTDGRLEKVLDGELASGTSVARSLTSSAWFADGTIIMPSNAPPLGLRYRVAALINSPKRSISGRVFADRNRNGVQDAGERPLVGWRVFVDKNSNGLLDRNEYVVRSSSTGYYEFFDLGRGTHPIRVIGYDGWVATSPQSMNVRLKKASDSEVRRFAFAFA